MLPKLKPGLKVIFETSGEWKTEVLSEVFFFFLLLGQKETYHRTQHGNHISLFRAQDKNALVLTSAYIETAELGQLLSGLLRVWLKDDCHKINLSKLYRCKVLAG